MLGDLQRHPTMRMKGNPLGRPAYNLPPANEVLRRLCFYTSLSVILFTGGGGGGIPACIAGGIPGCLAGLQGGGGIPACLAGLQAHTQGGISRPTPREGVFRPTPRGVDVSQHVLRQTPPQQMASAVGSMHPTGMHLILTQHQEINVRFIDCKVLSLIYPAMNSSFLLSQLCLIKVNHLFTLSYPHLFQI